MANSASPGGAFARIACKAKFTVVKLVSSWKDDNSGLNTRYLHWDRESWGSKGKYFHYAKVLKLINYELPPDK